MSFRASTAVGTTRSGIASETVRYDGNGNIIERIDPRGFVTTMVYDDRDRLMTRTEPEGGISSFQWDGTDRPDG